MGGLVETALAYVASPGTGVYRPVLVVHSWWGLTPSFTEFADSLAGRGFLVGCADLYDGAVATTQEEAGRLRRRRRAEPAYRVLQGCLARLSRHDQAAGLAPAVVGFSMGAHWAVWLAQHADPPVGAAVLYYGARGGDYSSATAPVLAHYAADDPFVTASARGSMEQAIARRGVPYVAFDYPGTAHWFAESDQPSFDPEASDLAMDRTVRFLDRFDTSHAAV